MPWDRRVQSICGFAKLSQGAPVFVRTRVCTSVLVCAYACVRARVRRRREGATHKHQQVTAGPGGPVEPSLQQTHARGGPWAQAGIRAERARRRAREVGLGRSGQGGRSEEGGGSGTLCSYYLTAARQAARDAEERSVQGGQLVESGRLGSWGEDRW